MIIIPNQALRLYCQITQDLIKQRLSKIPVVRAFDEEDVRGPDGKPLIDLDDGVSSDEEEGGEEGDDEEVYSDDNEAVYEENSDGDVFVSEDEQADDDDDEEDGEAPGDAPDWDTLVGSVTKAGKSEQDDEEEEPNEYEPPRKRRRRRTSTKEDGDADDGALPVMPERISTSFAHAHTREPRSNP